MTASRSPQSTGATLLYEIKQLELAVRARMDEVLRPIGITTIQYTALTVLDRRDDLTSAALARRSFVTAQSMGDIVSALERHGLIERHQDPTHGRRLTISLTKLGRDLLAQISDDVQSIENRMTEGLSRQEHEALRGVLYRCMKNLTGAHAEQPPGLPVSNAADEKPGSNAGSGAGSRGREASGQVGGRTHQSAVVRASG